MARFPCEDTQGERPTERLLYLDEKGIAVIRHHAEDFIRQKLAPADPVNDGKQTPMHGHPVFKAMHATACCCRVCLNKWHGIPLHRELSKAEQEKIVTLLMAWIERNKTHKIEQVSLFND